VHTVRQRHDVERRRNEMHESQLRVSCRHEALLRPEHAHLDVSKRNNTIVQFNRLSLSLSLCLSRFGADLRYALSQNVSDDRRLVRGGSGRQFEFSPCLGMAACHDAPNVRGHVAELLPNGNCQIVARYLSFYETFAAGTTTTPAPTVAAGNSSSSSSNTTTTTTTMSPTGFVLEFAGSESDRLRCGGNSTPVTRVVFECDPGATQAEPIVTETTLGVGGGASCGQTLLWRGPLGCPTCGLFDYSNQYSQCVDGMRRFSEVRNANSKCNGPSIRSSTTESCVAEYTFPWWAFIVVLVVIVLLAIIGAVVFFKYKRLTSRYESLEKSQDIGMTMVEDDDS
jgi:hypothetical protein